jgi:dipeptidyl-peptidase-3
MRYSTRSKSNINRRFAGMAVEKRMVGELERLGPEGREVLVLGVEAPGFEKLSTEKKIFAFYLYRAAIAGDSIMYMQCHRDALEIKHLLEGILQYSDGLSGRLKKAIHEYTKFIWVHHGQYHHYNHTKFVPGDLNFDDLLKASLRAVENGASIETRPGESMEEKLHRLERSIFDADYEPLQTNQAAGADIVATSAVNFWDPEVTGSDLEQLAPDWRDKLNVRFAKKDGKISPEVYKIGGLYGRELETVSYFLRLALPYAESKEQAKSIETLMEYYRTGDEQQFREHCIHWLQCDTEIDFVNGFIEQYIDPRGVIGNFEANVSFVSESSLLNRLAADALYFEERMPWPEKYKREKISKPVSNVVNVLVETGDSGPVSPAAYNLPNYNDIRRDYGSKNVILLNIENTRSKEIFEQSIKAFFLPEYRDNVSRYGNTTARPLEVYMHEIIGHGSGKPDPKTVKDPRTALGRAYSALEECRADLVALYHISDPKLIENGAFSKEEQHAVVETMFITYLQGWLSRYDRIDGLEVREAHNIGSQLILMYLLENGGAADKDFGVDIITVGGDYYVKIRDLQKAITGCGELLEKLQIIKSTGDRKGALELFDKYGTRVNPEWKANITARKEKLNLPKMKAFVFPHLKPVIEEGKIVDVEIFNDEDLTTQMLRFSRLRHVTDITAD